MIICGAGGVGALAPWLSYFVVLVAVVVLWPLGSHILWCWWWCWCSVPWGLITCGAGGGVGALAFGLSYLCGVGALTLGLSCWLVVVVLVLWPLGSHIWWCWWWCWPSAPRALIFGGAGGSVRLESVFLIFPVLLFSFPSFFSCFVLLSPRVSGIFSYFPVFLIF